MRPLNNINLALLSIVQISLGAVLTWLMRGMYISYKKGGNHSYSLLMRPANFLLVKSKKEMKTSYIKKPMDSRKVNLLISAAEWIRDRGQVRPISDIPVLEEEIGILFNIIRRRKKITLEKLATKSGFQMEELIAFEAGLLPRLRMCEMLPVLAKRVGFAYEDLLRQIQ
jgi:hypothetical protein